MRFLWLLSACPAQYGLARLPRAYCTVLSTGRGGIPVSLENRFHISETFWGQLSLERCDVLLQLLHRCGTDDAACNHPSPLTPTQCQVYH